MDGCQMDGCDEQPICLTSTHQRDTIRLRYPLTDGYFMGYQNNLILPVLRLLKDTITGRHRATAALRVLTQLLFTQVSNFQPKNRHL